MNYKPRKGPLAGRPFRLSLDRYVNKHIDSKTEAESVAADVRTKIDAGTYGKHAPQIEAMTIRQLADRYTADYVLKERPKTAKAFEYELNAITTTKMKKLSGQVVPFGEWRIDDVVSATLKQFKWTRRESGTGIVNTNRLLRRLRALYNWAADEDQGYTKRTPFRKKSKTKKNAAPLFEKEHPRKRRLGTPDCPDEEQKLLAGCNPHLRAIAECAIETGMRKGEILSLQWKEVHGLTLKTDDDGQLVMEWAARPEIKLPFEKTKTSTARGIPISARLRAVLEMRRLGPDHKPLEFDAFVFGTEIGTKVLGFKRAWNTAVLKSRGIEPTYTTTQNLDAVSRKAFIGIGLHFHDLRREAGSRWLEGGVPLHVVKEWLGHTNIAQTSTYLGTTLKVSHDAMARFDAQQIALQQIATAQQTAASKHTRATSRRHKTLNKTAREHVSRIM